VGVCFVNVCVRVCVCVCAYVCAHLCVSACVIVGVCFYVQCMYMYNTTLFDVNMHVRALHIPRANK
jgi:hypothetical protein